MSNLFNDDFIDFLKALQNNQVKYLLVGDYAVIMNGYVRSTSDTDVWLDKTTVTPCKGFSLTLSVMIPLTV